MILPTAPFQVTMEQPKLTLFPISMLAYGNSMLDFFGVSGSGFASAVAMYAILS